MSQQKKRCGPLFLAICFAVLMGLPATVMADSKRSKSDRATGETAPVLAGTWRYEHVDGGFVGRMKLKPSGDIRLTAEVTFGSEFFKDILNVDIFKHGFTRRMISTGTWAADGPRLKIILTRTRYTYNGRDRQSLLSLVKRKQDADKKKISAEQKKRLDAFISEMVSDDFDLEEEGDVEIQMEHVIDGQALTLRDESGEATTWKRGGEDKED